MDALIALNPEWSHVLDRMVEHLEKKSEVKAASLARQLCEEFEEHPGPAADEAKKRLQMIADHYEMAA